MGAFGERLRREREQRGVTLEQISQSTKISTRFLRALEEEDFAKLPGGIFNKGFVRAYARHLGLDEAQATTDYLQASGELQPPPLLTPPEAAADLPATITQLSPPPWPADDFMASDGMEQPTGLPRPLPWAAIAVAAVVALLGFAGWKAMSGRGTQPTASAPARAASQPQSATAAPPAPPPFVVKLRVQGDCWVAITADGKLLKQGVLEAPSEESVRAANQVVMKVGNAGGLHVFFNGKLLPPVGGEGEVKTLTFGPSGLQR